MDSPNLSAHKAACIKDRYIASTIDFILLLAIFGLFLPPIRKYILMFKLTEQDGPLLVTLFLVTLMSISLVFLYRVTFTITKGGTPGKLMTGLKVVNIWSGQPLTVFHIIVREFFGFFPLFCSVYLILLSSSTIKEDLYMIVLLIPS